MRNPACIKVYEEFLEEPGSHIAHEIPTPTILSAALIKGNRDEEQHGKPCCSYLYKMTEYRFRFFGASFHG